MSQGNVSVWFEGLGERLTSKRLFQIVHDEIEQLIVTFQGTDDCERWEVNVAKRKRKLQQIGNSRLKGSNGEELTFATTGELDPDLFVDVLAQI
jgi:hypothetical protein